MDVTLRTLTNVGDPLVLTDGTPLASVAILFDLVDDRRKKPISLFDAVSGEYIATGTKTATTDSKGEFTISLWPNIRGEVATIYKVTVGDLSTAPFYIRVPEGTGTLSLLAAKADMGTLTPQEATLFAAAITESTAAAAAASNQAGIATTKAGEASAAAASADASAAAAALSEAAVEGNSAAAVSSAASSALDAIATAADRVQTGLDAAATAADVIAIAGAEAQTGLDAIATAADRVQTGLDAAAAAGDASTATVQAGIATTKAGEAATSEANSAASAILAAGSAADAAGLVSLALAGAVVGPTGAVDGNIVVFDNTTGQLVKDSGSKPADFAAAATTYTKTETDNAVSQAISNAVVWKPSVANFAAIASTYPAPSEGWTTSCTDTNTVYRYDAGTTTWIQTDAGAIPAASTSVAGKVQLTDSTSSVSTTTAATPNSVKAAYDLASGKQDALVSGTNVKTVNGTSLLGSGDIVIAPGTGVTVSGMLSTYITQATTLTITNYDSATTYSVSATDGTATITGDTITYTAGATAGSVTLTITAGAATRDLTITVNSNLYIPTPAATPAAFGDAFEGGFYAGMIWNELVESATSVAIATGSKAFTVADMTSAPIVYFGQELEIRSRANPANKMVGTVTGAGGTTLDINVTSVGGSGTFTDWSIMAKYRVIVAPKSSGESSSKTYKNATTAAPTACQTLSEGYKATLAMVAAGNATVYPAAWFCTGLNIGSKTDWYLPARDELELCWRNLKPTTDSNYVTADRGDSAINYTNLGSLDDTDIAHGHNLNSSPAGAAYIAGTPAQVAAGKNFRTGESEAFAYGSYYYWSASEYSATDAWRQYWDSSYPGPQYYAYKNNAYYVRAVRRSII